MAFQISPGQGEEIAYLKENETSFDVGLFVQSGIRNRIAIPTDPVKTLLLKNQRMSSVATSKLKNRELKDEAIKKDERDAYYKISNQGLGRSNLNRNSQ